ncbi:hypothetical protein GTZ99_12615 [Novosphingobium sp. FSY-8]|uniref:PilZ domain-containing protein n=1 Tax=Novosphingobium ovatum TaxID=1908523 RepID=A0ABW9XFS0_9SPHN|nr:PilZ domain-containing protein [Novosphingobium ovatum]NBC37394.1 hypothetical protein [Novosphingobium ovatum]
MWPERRKHTRSHAEIHAAYHHEGARHGAMVVNVSPMGCCVDLFGGNVQPGERIALHLGEALVLPATVRWRRDHRVGLEFAVPLMGAMMRQYGDADMACQPTYH